MHRYVSPIDDRSRAAVPSAPRLSSLRGETIGLLDIRKRKGSAFLDRVEEILVEQHDVAQVVRLQKPTFTRPAPPDVLSEAERCGAVLVALAD